MVGKGATVTQTCLRCVVLTGDAWRNSARPPQFRDHPHHREHRRAWRAPSDWRRAPDARGGEQSASAALADALDRATEGEDVFAPLVDDRALNAVKFGDMVPDHMLRAEVAQR